MSDDARAGVAAAATRPGPVAALEALGHAARWATEAVPAVGEDDVAAFECVIAIDQALAELAGLLRRVPPLLTVAAAGQPVSDRLAAAEAEVGRRQSELTAARARLTAARDLEQRAAGIQAERDQLRRRIEELEQASLIERELPALRARRAELEAGLASASEGEGAEVVAALAAAAGRVLDLTREQQALIQAGNDQLGPALAAATEAAARERARHDELTAAVAAREAEAGQLTADHQRALPGLRARQEADSALLAGLEGGGLAAGADAGDGAAGAAGAGSRVRAELAAIERRLAATEDLLRPLLLEHAQAYEEARKVRGWTG